MTFSENCFTLQHSHEAFVVFNNADLKKLFFDIMSDLLHKKIRQF